MLITENDFTAKFSHQACFPAFVKSEKSSLMKPGTASLLSYFIFITFSKERVISFISSNQLFKHLVETPAHPGKHFSSKFRLHQRLFDLEMDPEKF